MAYTRQYTQGVGWENEPSINTPISAENLNQMDNAIMNIDAAIAAALAGGIGAECSGHEITRLASNNEAIYADILFDDDIVNHDTHIFFLTSEYAVPEKSDSPYYWRLWVRYKIESTTMGQNIMIYDMDGEPFDDAIPVGNQFICQLHIVDPSDSNTWYISELANISAGGASTLADLSDTHIYSPSEGDVLKYSNNGYWVNAAGGDERPMSDHIVSVDSSSPKLNTSSTRIGNFKEWELFFLRCDVDAHYDSGWSGGWHIYAGGTTDIGDIVDNRDHYLDSEDFKEDIPAGSLLVLARYPAPWTVWGLYAIIPAASIGGGRIFSDHIVSSSGARLNTSTNFLGDENFAEGDILFLYSDVNATNPDSNYTVSLGGTKLIGRLVDYRDGNDEAPFHEDIPAGTTLVITYTTDVLVKNLMLRAIIPAASGGGTHTDAINFKITSASSNTLVPVAIQRLAAPLNKGDLIFLYMSVNGTFDSEASATSWQLQYKLTDSTTITGSIANGLGSPSVSIFNSNLPQGTWLVLKSGVYDSTTHTQGFTCIAKIDPASGGGTTVVANPTGTATDTLEKLQVGSTIYEIPGIDTAWAGKVTAVSGGNITPNNASFSFDPFTDGKFVILDIGVDAVMPGSVTSWSLQYTVDGNTVTRGISDKRDGNAYDPDFDDDLVSGSVIVLQYFEDNKFACVAVLDQNGGGGASTLAGLSDTTISSPTAAQPLTYDAANRKWVNGGIIPIANGGTGNNSGYVRAGRKANTNIGNNATAEGQNNTASGNQSHAEGYNTQAIGYHSHAEGENSKATNGTAHAEGANTTASGSCSHAQGNSTTASGYCSSAAGRATTAGSPDQFVVGKYNDNKSTNIFEVGIGTGSGATPKINGLELDTSGNLKTAGTITDGDGNSLSSIAAQLGYLEQTVTLSTSASTTVTFTDSSITANSFIEYACSQWDLVPESITGAAGSCTIVLPKVDSAQSVTVRIYVR